MYFTSERHWRREPHPDSPAEPKMAAICCARSRYGIYSTRGPIQRRTRTPAAKSTVGKNHKFRVANAIGTRICQAMCEYGMKEFQVALSVLADVESVFKKRYHQDLVRSLKSINSSSDASVDFISQKTLSASPEAAIVDSHAQEDDHEALDHSYSPTIDIVDDVSNKNARATVSSDGEDPNPTGSARARAKASCWRMYDFKLQSPRLAARLRHRY